MSMKTWKSICSCYWPLTFQENFHSWMNTYVKSAKNPLCRMVIHFFCIILLLMNWLSVKCVCIWTTTFFGGRQKTKVTVEWGLSLVQICTYSNIQILMLPQHIRHKTNMKNVDLPGHISSRNNYWVLCITCMFDLQIKCFSPPVMHS